MANGQLLGGSRRGYFCRWLFSRSLLDSEDLLAFLLCAGGGRFPICDRLAPQMGGGAPFNHHVRKC